MKKPMKNMAEMMPAADSNPEKPRLEDDEIDQLLGALDDHEKKELAAAAKERAELAMQEEIRRLGEILDSLPERQAAIAAEQQVEAALKEVDSLPAAQDKRRPQETIDVAVLGEAKLRSGLKEFMASGIIDVVLENYKHDFAELELFKKPFGAVLESIGISDQDDDDRAAESLLREHAAGYAAMSPEAQAAARRLVGTMTSKIIGDLRARWHSGVIGVVKNKRAMLIDNQRELESAMASIHGNPTALKLHQESEEKNRRLIENANTLISGFENAS